MNNSVRCPVLQLLCVWFLVLPAAAQTGPNTKGVHLGAAFSGSSLEFDDKEVPDAERENGVGLMGYVGYNFMPSLGIFLSGTAASVSINKAVGDFGVSTVDDFTLGHGDLGARLSFPGNTAFVPYIEAAYSVLQGEGDAGVQHVVFTGNGFTGAAGLNYFFSPKLALDLNFRFTKGEFDEIEVSGDSESIPDGLGLNSGRLNIGIAFYPMAGRRR